jgi:hypothetical protein
MLSPVCLVLVGYGVVGFTTGRALAVPAQYGTWFAIRFRDRQPVVVGFSECDLHASLHAAGPRAG